MNRSQNFQPEAPRDIFDRLMALPGLRHFAPLYHKYKSALLYLFFGGLTTLVSIGSYALADRLLHIHELIANLFSWVCAVSFAYGTNRVWVFSSTAKGRAVFREALSFYAGRLITLGIEEAMLAVFVSWLAFDGLTVKVIAQFVVLILNYFISKLLVFRKP